MRPPKIDCCKIGFCKIDFSLPIFILFLLPKMVFGLDISPDISAAIIVNPVNGKVLFERNAHESRYPASTTKIATIGYILNRLKPQLKEQAYVSQEAVKVIADAEKAKGGYRIYPSYLQEARGTSASLPAGIQVTIEDLLYGAMLPSGNDACNVLAEHFGGTIQSFLDDLNEYVKSLGCKNTFFTNPHGLFHPDHSTTAFELVLIARDAMKNPQFRSIVSSSEYQTDIVVKGKRLSYRQPNKLLKPGAAYCAYATGIKTGHLARAKHCLVASCKNNDRELIAVFLKCTDRGMMFLEMKRVMDTLMEEQVVHKQLLKPGVLSLAYHSPEVEQPITCYTDEECVIKFYPSEEPKLKAVVTWDVVTPPIQRGQRVGILRFMEGSDEIAQVQIRAQESVEYSWGMFISRFLQRSYIKELLIIAALVLLGGFFMKKLYFGRR